MLVLTRKQGQRIVIDSRVVVTVMGCDRGRVRLAIDAPAEIPVRRAETKAPAPGVKEPVPRT